MRMRKWLPVVILLLAATALPTVVRWREAFETVSWGQGTSVTVTARRALLNGPPAGNTDSYVAACIVVKDEHCDIREWVLHHASIGIHKFYMFDTQSDPPMRPVLEDLIDSGLVEYWFVTNETVAPNRVLRPKREGYSINWQLHLYTRCNRKLGQRHTWMAFIDADEFIVLEAGMPSLPALLRPYQDRNYTGVALHWRIFGFDGHVLRPSGGVLQSYTACCDGGWASVGYKSIVQPAHVVRYISPHNFKLWGRGAVDTQGNALDDDPRSGKDVASYPGAALHHYFTRSLADYKQKMQRRAGDGTAKGLHDFIEAAAQCLAQCSQAVPLGKALEAQHDLRRNVPESCEDPRAAALRRRAAERAAAGDVGGAAGAGAEQR